VQILEILETDSLAVLRSVIDFTLALYYTILTTVDFLQLLQVLRFVYPKVKFFGIVIAGLIAGWMSPTCHPTKCVKTLV